MKTQQVLFNSARLVLGTSHLVFQTLADASMNAEAAVVAKTGYWEGDKQYVLTPRQLTQYKAQRKLHTSKTQKKVSAKVQTMKDMIEAKKKIAFKQV